MDAVLDHVLNMDGELPPPADPQLLDGELPPPADPQLLDGELPPPAADPQLLDGELPPPAADPQLPPTVDHPRPDYVIIKESNLVALVCMSYIGLNKNGCLTFLAPRANFRPTKREQIEDHGNNSLRSRLKNDASFHQTVFPTYRGFFVGCRKEEAATENTGRRDVFTDISDKFAPSGHQALIPNDRDINEAIKVLDPDGEIRTELGLDDEPSTVVYCDVVSHWSSTRFMKWNVEKTLNFIESNFDKVDDNLWLGECLFDDVDNELPKQVCDFTGRAKEQLEEEALLQALRIFIILNLAKLTKLVLCYSNGNHRLLGVLYWLLGLNEGTSFKKIQCNANHIRQSTERGAKIALQCIPRGADLLRTLHHIANNSCNEAKDFSNNSDPDNLLRDTIPHLMMNCQHHLRNNMGMTGSYTSSFDALLSLYLDTDNFEKLLMTVNNGGEVEGADDDEFNCLRNELMLREEHPNLEALGLGELKSPGKRRVLRLGADQFWKLFGEVLSKIFRGQHVELEPFIKFWNRKGKLGDSFGYNSSFRFLSLTLHNLFIFNGLTAIHHEMTDERIREAMKNVFGWKSLAIEELLEPYYDEKLRSLAILPGLFQGNLNDVTQYLKATLQKCLKNLPAPVHQFETSSTGYSLYNVFLLCLIEPNNCWAPFGNLIDSSSGNGGGTQKIVQAVAATTCCLAAVVAHRICPGDTCVNQTKGQKQSFEASESIAPFHSAVASTVLSSGGILRAVVGRWCADRDRIVELIHDSILQLQRMQVEDTDFPPTFVRVEIGGRHFPNMDIPIDFEKPLPAALILYLRKSINRLYVTDSKGAARLKEIENRVNRRLLGAGNDDEMDRPGLGAVIVPYPFLRCGIQFANQPLSPRDFHPLDNDNNGLVEEEASNGANTDTEDEGGSSESGELFPDGSNEMPPEQEQNGGGGDTTTTGADSAVAVAVAVGQKQKKRKRKGSGLAEGDGAQKKAKPVKIHLPASLVPYLLDKVCGSGSDAIASDEKEMIKSYRESHSHPQIDDDANRAAVLKAIIRPIRQWYKKAEKGVSSNNKDNSIDNSSQPQHQHHDENLDFGSGSGSDNGSNDDHSNINDANDDTFSCNPDVLLDNRMHQFWDKLNDENGLNDENERVKVLHDEVRELASVASDADENNPDDLTSSSDEDDDEDDDKGDKGDFDLMTYLNQRGRNGNESDGGDSFEGSFFGGKELPKFGHLNLEC